MKASSSYEKRANLIFPPLSSFQLFCSPVKASQQKCLLYIYLVFVAGPLLSFLRMDLGFPVKQGSGPWLCSPGLLWQGSSCLQKGFPAQLLPRWVRPKGMGVLWGQTELELFPHILLKAKVNKKPDFDNSVWFRECCQYGGNVTTFVLQSRILFLPKRKHQNLIM